ncbi:hypothetical protein TVAG_199000 [Trichomonas vaginalis G3]|uniref:Ricin B lectin domain-containing protein n=1 Tax=Trichomonas vaginalis (strain ATCC PRA-98 / G3) TaxID=412133 RepID=A2DDT5_TRIV3|nr:hypothetical protein TVAGG3_0999500 [Trichomonas vaginalis G3]EAY21461.1 hypothetical protein TVAG_199000 [Trichomonas vaginalis G3]KAI5490674.1 hypothetical protein TVAGG3_0999500 [Trichomonas vaginalis G3]|eukprot:XP_001582447.1 hypothetical protein [Trichomonas vaginalis G3]
MLFTLTSFSLSASDKVTVVHSGALVALKNEDTWAYADAKRSLTTGKVELYSTLGDPDTTRYWTVLPIQGQNFSHIEFQCGSNVTFMNTRFSGYLSAGKQVLPLPHFAKITRKNRPSAQWSVLCKSDHMWKRFEPFQLRNIDNGCYLASTIRDSAASNDLNTYPLICQDKPLANTYWTVQEGLFQVVN